MFMKLRNSVFFPALFFSSILFAAPYVIGDKLEVVSLHDQHEKPGAINEATRIILFSRDKKGGELLTNALSSMPKGFLAQQKIVYVTDISGMPGLIAKYMAIPAMQKKTYPILLDKDGNSTINYPDKNGMATLIYVESLTITKVIYLDSIDSVVKILTTPETLYP